MRNGKSSLRKLRKQRAKLRFKVCPIGNRIAEKSEEVCAFRPQVLVQTIEFFQLTAVPVALRRIPHLAHGSTS